MADPSDIRAWQRLSDQITTSGRLEPHDPARLAAIGVRQVINLAMQAMQVAFKVAIPLLLVGLVIGLAVSVFQAVTQIQEQTLTFIPKIVGMGLVLVVAGPWMLSEVVTYTQQLYGSIPEMVAGG